MCCFESTLPASENTTDFACSSMYFLSRRRVSMQHPQAKWPDSCSLSSIVCARRIEHTAPPDCTEDFLEGLELPAISNPCSRRKLPSASRGREGMRRLGRGTLC